MGQLSIIDPKKGIFSKLEYGKYDIFVPFVCLKTGRRCKSYTPSIPEWNLMVIAHDLHRDENELFRTYRKCYVMSLTSHPEPCLFLDENNLCVNYNHPLRPSVCRLYPFSYEGADETCPGYQKHKHLVTVLIDHTPPCRIYDASFCPNLTLRLVPDQDWPEILEIFQGGGPCPEMEKKFIEWNH